MNKLLRQYPYGFAFSDLTFDNLPKTYELKRVLNKFNYYYDNYNNLYQTKSDFIIIHGHFKHVGINGQVNIDDDQLLPYLLEQYINNYSKFLETLDFIGGRYVIIIGNLHKINVYPDACACRSAYYTMDRNIVVSHVEMIIDNYAYKRDPLVQKASKLGISFNNSPYLGIKSILPNISIDIIKKESTRFFPIHDNQYHHLDDNNKIDLIEKLWKDQLDYYISNYENVILSLTAGNDSRVSLAMCREHMSKIRFFTYAPQKTSTDAKQSKFANTLNVDKNVVNQIVNDNNINHEFILFGDGDSSFTKEEVYTLNKNSIKPHGRFLLKLYNSTFSEKKVLHIRAQLFEIGRAYFLNNDRPNTLDAVRNVFYFNHKNYKELFTKSDLDSMFDSSIDQLHYDHLYDYHILDFYFWDNRVGRWFSEVLNETDSAFETFLPFNMRAIIDISLSFDIEKRRGSYMFKELINRNYPVLNFYGENEIKNIYEQNRDQKYSQSPIVEKANVYNDIDDNILSFSLSNEILYLPKDFIKKDYYSEVEIVFNEKYGIAEIEVESRYASANAENYLRYELLVNDEVRIQEDMSKWKFSNKICLMNLMKNDSIKLRVIALRNTPQDSWQKASQLKVLSYNEKLIDQSYPAHTSCTSPFSIINNGL